MKVFRNTETGEKVYSLAPKRGNRAHAKKKVQKLNEILRAFEDLDVDFDFLGSRPDKVRLTRMLFIILHSIYYYTNLFFTVHTIHHIFI